MNKLRPMLAAVYEPDRLNGILPVYGQPKYDGIRCLVKGGVGLSRTLKPIPNRFVQEVIRTYGSLLEGIDGELIVGSPTDPKGYNTTQSAVMTASGSPQFTFWAFDRWNTSMHFEHRFDTLRHVMAPALDSRYFAIAPTELLPTRDYVDAYISKTFGEGYEGVILRRAEALYKFNRATAKQGQLLKIKSWEDAEAVVHGFEEMESNQNEAQVDALGLTKRSSHKANKVPMGTLGKLLATGKYPDGTPFEAKIGSGFDMAQRQEIWDNQDRYLGRMVKFKYIPHGVKDNPRHPIFLGWRHPDDL